MQQLSLSEDSLEKFPIISYNNTLECKSLCGHSSCYNSPDKATIRQCYGQLRVCEGGFVAMKSVTNAVLESHSADLTYRDVLRIDCGGGGE